MPGSKLEQFACVIPNRRVGNLKRSATADESRYAQRDSPNGRARKDTIYNSRRHQLLPPFERHGAIADSSDLSHTQEFIPSRFRPNRPDYPHLPIDGFTSSAAGGELYGPKTASVFITGRNDVYADRIDFFGVGP